MQNKTTLGNIYFSDVFLLQLAYGVVLDFFSLLMNPLISYLLEISSHISTLVFLVSFSGIL